MKADAFTARALLKALQTPHSPIGLARATNLTHAQVRASLRKLVRNGRAQRIAPATYLATPAPPVPRAPQAPARPPRAPAGTGVQGARLAYLLEHYERYGYKLTAAALDISPARAWQVARAHGLAYGDVPGRILLSDLARLTGIAYPNLWARARRDGVAVSAPGTRRKITVPLEWSDRVHASRDLLAPGPTDVPLASVARATGVARSTLRYRCRHEMRLALGPNLKPIVVVPAALARELTRRPA